MTKLKKCDCTQYDDDNSEDWVVDNHDVIHNKDCELIVKCDCDNWILKTDRMYSEKHDCYYCEYCEDYVCESGMSQDDIYSTPRRL